MRMVPGLVRVDPDDLELKLQVGIRNEEIIASAGEGRRCHAGITVRGSVRGLSAAMSGA